MPPEMPTAAISPAATMSAPPEKIGREDHLLFQPRDIGHGGPCNARHVRGEHRPLPDDHHIAQEIHRDERDAEYDDEQVDDDKF